MKKTLIVPALLFVALCTASAKQYSISFVKPVQVGSVTLAAGEYKLKVDGANVVFTNSTRKTFTAPAKVEKIEKKAAYTAAETKDVNGTEKVDIIDLEGADFKLVF